MKEYRYSNKSLIVFLTIVIILSAIVEALICKFDIQVLYIVLMWIPASASLVASIISIKDRKEKLTIKYVFVNEGFRKCKWKYILLACGLPLVYISIPYIIFWCMYPESIDLGENMTATCIRLTVMFFGGIFISLLSALGEEIGWRGFMFSSLLERVGLHRTILFTSAFWCIWHLPVLIGGSYMEGTPMWYKISAFVLRIFASGAIAGLLAYKSKSMWPAAFFHAAHNNFDQAVFGSITVSDKKMYFVSETGIFTIICAWPVAVVLYGIIIRSKENDRS